MNLQQSMRQNIMEFIEAISTATVFSARRFLIVTALIQFIFILHIALYVEHQAGNLGNTYFQNWCDSTGEYNRLPLSSLCQWAGSRVY